MKAFLFLLCALLGLASAQQTFKQRRTEKLYRGNMLALQTILAQPQMLERYLTGNESFHVNLKGSDSILGFSWSNCGSGSDPVQIHTLSVSPDPVKIPGDLSLSFDISSSVDIQAPFKVNVDISKKVAFWWVEVPCVDNVGSCDYDNFCTLLPATCPPSFQQYNIPCNCPAEQGDYVMPTSSITIPDLPFPSWLSTGDYKIKIQGSDSSANGLFCFTMQLSLD